MITIKTKYLGNLRTQAIHIKSSNTIITDAPIDNQGKGEAFSPTDLLSASLTSCMMTIMGIAAKKHGLIIDGVVADTTKIMSTNPRRIAEIIIEFSFSANNFTQQQKEILQEAAHSCPVALSLHPEIKQTIKFNF